MSETVGQVLNTLKDMGFSEERAKKALNKTGWKGVEPAMEWLLAHPENADESESEEELEVPQEEVKPKKELTAEEKAEQLKKLEELRIKKRKEREEREAKETLEREKRMREEGRAMTDLKQKLADQEMIRAAEERRREKRETQLARERVRAQIEADRKARKEEEARRRGEVVDQPPPSKPTVSSSPAPTKDYDKARIQIRLPNGSTMVNSFQAKEPLSAVRLYIELNRKDGDSNPQVKLMTSFPRKVFSEEDYESSLESLGLVPSSVIIVTK